MQQQNQQQPQQQQQYQQRRRRRRWRQQRQRIHETGVGDFRCPELKRPHGIQRKKRSILFLSNTTGSNKCITFRTLLVQCTLNQKVDSLHTNANTHSQTYYYSHQAGIHLIERAQHTRSLSLSPVVHRPLGVSFRWLEVLFLHLLFSSSDALGNCFTLTN